MTATIAALLAEARQRGSRRAVLETTETWEDVVRFYLRAGFHITHRQDGDIYFERILDGSERLYHSLPST